MSTPSATKDPSKEVALDYALKWAACPHGSPAAANNQFLPATPTPAAIVAAARKFESYLVGGGDQ